MQRQVMVAALSIVAMTGCKDSPWTPMGSAELVLSEIKMGGAAKVASRIDSDENFGRSVTAGIATGDSSWLQVAKEIRPASAAAQATLSIALASALTRAPARVLSILGRTYPVEEVCGIPFLRADSAEVISYHDQAAGALASVKDSTLVKQTASCRTALDEAKDRRLERINPGYVIKNKPTPVRSTRKKR